MVARILLSALVAATISAGGAMHAQAQGPSPEGGATLFPGGGVVSYNSVFTTRSPRGTGPLPASARPTFAHRGQFTFAWGIKRDLQLTLLAPVVTTERKLPDSSFVGGTGFGDVTVMLKYRVLRLDSPRGTTQLSLAAGPKLPTGRTNLRDPAGSRLPVGLQPGSGSTDAVFAASFTYTGLFGIKRLVADESLTYTLRTKGSQQMELGDSLESRFWLSYRPYQSKDVGAEWFIGPALVWHHNGRDRQAGARLADSGGDALALGVTTFVSPAAGWHLWFAFELPVAQTQRGAQNQLDHRFSIGITRQFYLGRIH